MYAYLLKPNGERGYLNFNDPTLKLDGVILRVVSCGLCGSDIHKYKTESLPRGYLKTQILGHEIAGIIEDIGSEVTGYERNDHVAVRPIINCGSCEPCRSGRYQFCVEGKSIGKDLDGGFAEYIYVPSKNIRRVYTNIPLDVVALTDPLAVAVHCFNLVENSSGKRVGIIGDGTIGLCCAYTSLNLGYSQVTVFGKHEGNLAIARDLGAKTRLVDPHQNKPYDREKIFDVIIETVGRRQSKTIEESVRMIGIGGKIVVAGVFDHDFRGSFPFRDLGWKEATLIGANSYSMYRGEDEFDIALRMIHRNPEDLRRLITHHYPLSRMDEAIDLMTNKREEAVIKIVIKPGERDG